MNQPSTQGITRLLHAWHRGEEDALERLMPVVYEQLRKAAKLHLSRDERSIQATDLVHDLYMRLVGCHEINWDDRGHFFAVCAKIMRRVLIDSARARHSQKRGRPELRVELNEALALSREHPNHMLALDEALTRLSEVDPRKGQTVELRFFGGLSIQETAVILNVSEKTVQRDWRMAKLWLLHALS